MPVESEQPRAEINNHIYTGGPFSVSSSAFQARPRSAIVKEVRLKPAHPVLTPDLPTSCGLEEARGSLQAKVFRFQWIASQFSKVPLDELLNLTVKNDTRESDIVSNQADRCTGLKLSSVM